MKLSLCFESFFQVPSLSARPQESCCIPLFHCKIYTYLNSFLLVLLPNQPAWPRIELILSFDFIFPHTVFEFCRSGAFPVKWTSLYTIVQVVSSWSSNSAPEECLFPCSCLYTWGVVVVLALDNNAHTLRHRTLVYLSADANPLFALSSKPTNNNIIVTEIYNMVRLWI